MRPVVKFFSFLAARPEKPTSLMVIRKKNFQKHQQIHSRNNHWFIWQFISAAPYLYVCIDFENSSSEVQSTRNYEQNLKSNDQTISSFCQWYFFYILIIIAKICRIFLCSVSFVRKFDRPEFQKWYAWQHGKSSILHAWCQCNNSEIIPIKSLQCFWVTRYYYVRSCKLSEIIIKNYYWNTHIYLKSFCNCNILFLDNCNIIWMEI